MVRFLKSCQQPSEIPNHTMLALFKSYYVHSFHHYLPLDDAEKSTVSHTVLTCSKQYLHNTKRENLGKSTGVVPTKYPPNVKLKLFTTLECQNWGKLCVPQLVRVLGLLQQQRVDIFSLVQKSFPYRSPYKRILRNPFLVRVLLISTKCEAQDISLYTQMWRPSKAMSGSSASLTPFSFIGVSFPSSLPKVLPSAIRSASWIN